MDGLAWASVLGVVTIGGIAVKIFKYAMKDGRHFYGWFDQEGNEGTGAASWDDAVKDAEEARG